MYYVYTLESLKDKRFYFGFTKDLEKRVQQHNTGLTESTKNRPFKLIYYEVYLNKKDAIAREKYLRLVGVEVLLKRILSITLKSAVANNSGACPPKFCHLKIILTKYIKNVKRQSRLYLQ